AQTVRRHLSSLKAAQECRYLVGDAALYCADTLQLLALRIPVKLNSDSGICEHHFRKVCGQGFFEQKLSFEGRH
ncbi:hypothetical protein, partial [Aeromonas caviae]|uniref:hypothetical protein n=1 Tax=Aeromonas caviae TaxID=648 RepID=UPI001FC7CFB2